MKRKIILCLFSIVLFSNILFSTISIFAISYIPISLNTIYTLYASQGTSKYYSSSIPNDKYYKIYVSGSNNINTTVVTSDYTYQHSGYNYAIEFNETSSTVYFTLTCQLYTGSYSRFVVRPMVASLYGYDYSDLDAGDTLDTTSDLNYPHQYLSPLLQSTKYSDAVYNNVEHMVSNDSRGLPYIDSDIFLYSGHGQVHYLELPGGALKRLWDDTPHQYDDITKSVPQMYTCKVAVLSACNTAINVPSGHNLAQYFVMQGAKSCIGWPGEILDFAGRIFVNRLFKEMCENDETISGAADIAKDLFPFGVIKQYIIYGNSSTKIIQNYNDGVYVNSLDLTDHEFDALYTKICEDNDLYLIETSSNYYIFYVKINGEKSNAYYLTVKKGNNYYILEDHTKNYKEKPILHINYEYFETKGYLDFCENNTIEEVTDHYYYYVDDDCIVPLSYLCVHYTNDSKSKYTEFIVNLSTGEEMPYEKYGIID